MKSFDDVPIFVVDFLNYSRTIQGKSEMTVIEYYYDLRMFLNYMQNLKIIDIKNIKLNHIYIFMAYLANERKISNSSRCRKISTIKSFFRYLYKKARYIDEDPTIELEKPKIDKTIPIYLNIEESRNLLNTIDGKHSIRDYAMVTLFLNCGLRLSELVNINISKIKDDKLVVMGKGKKERTIYLNSACLKAIQDYLNIRGTGITIKDKDALFLSERNCRISKKTVQYIVKKHIQSSGLDKKYSTHKLRHTAATLMYKHGGVDVLALKDILGHENVNTTQIYTHVDNEILKDSCNKNPLSDMKRAL